MTRTEHNISTELLATTVLGLLQVYCFRPILLTTAYTDSVVDTWYLIPCRAHFIAL